MPLKWDSYSDQPEVIKDRAYKKRIYKEIRWDSFKMLATNALLYPAAYLFYLLFPVKKIELSTQDFFGMSVNLDKNPEDTKELVDDLQVNTLLIRVPLSDIKNIRSYVTFAEQFKDKKLLINILQDRQHVEDLPLLKQSLDDIFKQFSHLTNHFQIGNAINRKKWAIFSMDEFLKFYKVAYDLKKNKYPEFILLGSSVIDFEYYFSIRTLFNFHKIYYDQFSSLLYVDRRGAPENTQMGLDLIKKLHLLHAMLRLSPKSSTDIIITETNWPIKNTAPYAPTSEKECVSLEDHANFLVRYYLLALASGVAKNVVWHQLIAPGYGLVDNRDGKLIKYPAYYAFKNMLALLQGATYLGLDVKDDIYSLSLIKSEKKIDVLWSVSSTKTINASDKQVIARDGKILDVQQVNISGSPIYLIALITTENV